MSAGEHPIQVAGSAAIRLIESVLEALESYGGGAMLLGYSRTGCGGRNPCGPAVEEKRREWATLFPEMQTALDRATRVLAVMSRGIEGDLGSEEARQHMIDEIRRIVG